LPQSHVIRCGCNILKLIDCKVSRVSRAYRPLDKYRVIHFDRKITQLLLLIYSFKFRSAFLYYLFSALAAVAVALVSSCDRNFDFMTDLRTCSMTGSR